MTEAFNGRSLSSQKDTKPVNQHRRPPKPAQLTWDKEGLDTVIRTELAKPPRGRKKLGKLIRSTMATDLTRPEPVEKGTGWNQELTRPDAQGRYRIIDPASLKPRS